MSVCWCCDWRAWPSLSFLFLLFVFISCSNGPPALGLHKGTPPANSLGKSLVTRLTSCDMLCHPLNNEKISVLGLRATLTAASTHSAFSPLSCPWWPPTSLPKSLVWFHAWPFLIVSRKINHCFFRLWQWCFEEALWVCLWLSWHHQGSHPNDPHHPNGGSAVSLEEVGFLVTLFLHTQSKRVFSVTASTRQMRWMIP